MIPASYSISESGMGNTPAVITDPISGVQTLPIVVDAP